VNQVELGELNDFAGGESGAVGVGVLANDVVVGFGAILGGLGLFGHKRVELSDGVGVLLGLGFVVQVF
jgi:hypothetical protein